MNGAALLRLLGDDARLRILRVLQSERLNVGELTGIVGIAQSGVSRHLGLLKEAGLVIEQREGGFTYFQAASAEAANGAAALQPFLQSHFDAHAGPDTKQRQLIPGRSWAAWARALGHLLPPVRVADLGCGEGYLTIEASKWASRVIAVDRSPSVLERGRALARRRRVRNVIWKRGELENLPLRDASVDVALLSQALHHASDPSKALAEAARVVAPGGKVLVLDLREHDQEWARERLGDVWLGFTDERLARLLKNCGLIDVTVSVGSRRAGDPFIVLIASGTKPENQHAATTSENGRRKTRT